MLTMDQCRLNAPDRETRYGASMMDEMRRYDEALDHIAAWWRELREAFDEAETKALANTDDLAGQHKALAQIEHDKSKFRRLYYYKRYLAFKAIHSDDPHVNYLIASAPQSVYYMEACRQTFLRMPLTLPEAFDMAQTLGWCEAFSDVIDEMVEREMLPEGTQVTQQ